MFPFLKRTEGHLARNIAQRYTYDTPLFPFLQRTEGHLALFMGVRHLSFQRRFPFLKRTEGHLAFLDCTKPLQGARVSIPQADGRAFSPNSSIAIHPIALGFHSSSGRKGI